MKQVQYSDRQSSFIFYLVHQGKGRTEAARLAGFAAPRQSAFSFNTDTKDHSYPQHSSAPPLLSPAPQARPDTVPDRVRQCP